MSVPEKIGELLSELANLSDRDERADYLIDLAARFAGVPETIASRPYPESHRVPACESEAFVFCQVLPGGSLKFHIAVENPQGISAKALAVILQEGLSGCSTTEIQAVPEQIVHDVFGNTVSMGKGAGLMGMVRLAKQLAAERVSQRS